MKRYLAFILIALILFSVTVYADEIPGPAEFYDSPYVIVHSEEYGYIMVVGEGTETTNKGNTLKIYDNQWYKYENNKWELQSGYIGDDGYLYHIYPTIIYSNYDIYSVTSELVFQATPAPMTIPQISKVQTAFIVPNVVQSLRNILAVAVVLMGATMGVSLIYRVLYRL